MPPPIVFLPKNFFFSHSNQHKHTPVIRFAIISLLTLNSHASDLTGPSSGSTLNVVVQNNYLTILCSLAYVEEPMEILPCRMKMCSRQNYYTES